MTYNKQLLRLLQTIKLKITHSIYTIDTVTLQKQVQMN